MWFSPTFTKASRSNNCALFNTRQISSGILCPASFKAVDILEQLQRGELN